jgi:hypothetical protein
VVIDTNVLISIIIGKKLREILFHFKKNRFELIFSDLTYAEFLYVLKRPKFSKYFSARDILEFIDILKLRSRFVYPIDTIKICRDPQDNIFLECALAGHADFIISGDPDLLVLHPFQNISIINPKEFILKINSEFNNQ